MSSNSVPSLAISKSVNSPAQLISPSQSQASSSFNAESHPQRRSGGSGIFGAGSTSRSNLSAPRNNQSSRRQHKGQRRPRLADEDAMAESAAMKSTSSRKGQTSITHLMNFSLPPRPQNHLPTFGRNSRKNPAWGLGSGYHAMDKARYVHANYRFIVDPNEDYRAQAVDADVHLDWNTVMQVLASAQSQSTNCPICLSTPVAPRMAKCGHIFCLPCLIRYMHSTDDTKPMPEKKARWKKCPICWDSVYVSETRPVRWITGQEGETPREGGDVVLRLITRQPGSILALPRDGAESLEKPDEIPWYFAAEVTDYARVMKGSEDYMKSQFDSEMEDLQQQEREDELMFGEETQWTRRAVSAIAEAKERLKGLGNPPSAPKQPTERNVKRPPIEFHGSSETVPDFYAIQQATKSGQSSSKGSTARQHRNATSLPTDSKGAPLASSNGPVVATVPAPSISAVSSSTSLQISAVSTLPSMMPELGARGNTASQHQPNDSPFFFYQALIHYYLSPLDIRILKAAFGDFGSFPATILPRVERVSTGHIVDDELRKRAKYLAHLPYGCEVGFLECDWTDVVVPEILGNFATEIERRRKKNREKEVREEKERVRAEKEEDDKRWAAVRRKRPNASYEASSEVHFQPPAPLEKGFSASPSVGAVTVPSSPPWSSLRTHSGSAFASLASPSTSPVAPRTVWGTTAVVPTSPTLSAVPHDHEASDNDGWLQGWEQDLLGEEDVVAQFQAHSIYKDSSVVGTMAGTMSANSRKKKNKKITLMTTNARRGA